MKIALNGGEPVRQKFLPFNRPSIGNEEIEEVISTLKSGWITTGSKTKRFENKFQETIGVKHAIAVNSCTAALHLCLEACGVKSGDEVITTPYTFAATANVIEQLGAKTVFCDIENTTLNMDVSKLENIITDKTRVIIPVHFAGHPCDMDKIMEIASKKNIYVIEDAAHATEAVYKGRKIGTIGHMTCFSFYATKNLCCGEGGMVTTDDDEFAERIRIMSLHGMSKDAWKRYENSGSWYYEIIDCGFKYNFTDISASLGLWQLEKLEDNWEKRYEIVKKYNNFFEKYEIVTTPFVKENIKHSWHLYPLRINFEKLECDRKEFINALNAENIGASVHFIPLHIMPYYRNKYGFTNQSFPVAYEEYLKEITLPLFPDMTENDINDVCLAVDKLLKFFMTKIAVIKKIDNRELNLRSIKANQYLNEHEIMTKIKSYQAPAEFSRIREELERKVMEFVLDTISIYYEDESWDYLKEKINNEVEKVLNEN